MTFGKTAILLFRMVVSVSMLVGWPDTTGTTTPINPFTVISGTPPSLIGSKLFHPTNERGGYCSARMTFIKVF